MSAVTQRADVNPYPRDARLSEAYEKGKEAGSKAPPSGGGQTGQNPYPSGDRADAWRKGFRDGRDSRSDADGKRTRTLDRVSDPGGVGRSYARGGGSPEQYRRMMAKFKDDKEGWEIAERAYRAAGGRADDQPPNVQAALDSLAEQINSLGQKAKAVVGRLDASYRNPGGHEHQIGGYYVVKDQAGRKRWYDEKVKQIRDAEQALRSRKSLMEDDVLKAIIADCKADINENLRLYGPFR